MAHGGSWSRALGLLCVGMMVGCASSTAPRDTLYQVSVASALLAGDLDGEVAVDELLRHGNFGLGTFTALDGEMIVLNGTVYRAKGDGTVEKALPKETTPFAVVTRFRTDSQVTIDHPIKLDELEKRIDESLDNPNIFYALRIETRVPMIKIRSFAKQSKPYRDLLEVVHEQKTWTHEDIKGTFVGIRSPAYVGTMAVPGYHWHFISSDREIGGHVLEAILDRDAVDIDHVVNWDLALPETDEFGTLELNNDRVRDLEIIEK